MAVTAQIEEFVSTVSTGQVELSSEEVLKYRSSIAKSGLLNEVKEALIDLLDNEDYAGFLSMWESLTQQEA